MSYRDHPEGVEYTHLRCERCSGRIVADVNWRAPKCVDCFTRSPETIKSEHGEDGTTGGCDE